jgi:hypothetical protein
MKLYLSVRKGTFFRYRESSKEYQIYTSGQRHIEVRKYVYFEEGVSFRISRGSHMHIDSEKREEMVSSPPHPSIVQREPIEPIDTVDLVDPVNIVNHVDVSRDISVS